MSARRISALLILSLNLGIPLLHGQVSSTAAARARERERGSLENGIYRNSRFGFQFKVPYGWVDRTEQMRDNSLDPGKSILLLAVFERPPEAKGETVN